MQKQKYGRGVGVAFCEGEEVEIIVSDVEVVYPFGREAGGYGGGFFFCVGEEGGEVFDGGHGDVAAVVAREEGFAFEVEEENCGGHGWGGGGVCRVGREGGDWSREVAEVQVPPDAVERAWSKRWSGYLL